MRIFTLFTAAAMCTGLYAQPSLPHQSVKRPEMKQMLQRSQTSVFKAPAQSRGEEDEIIWEAPEGELTLLSRKCDSFTVEGTEATVDKVVGSVVKLLTTEDGEVYIGNAFSSYPVESWITATKEGTTLTIEGIQPIYIDYDYDTYEEYRVCAIPLDVVVDENGYGTCVPAADLRYELTLNEDGEYENKDRNKILGVCMQLPDYEGGYSYHWTGYGDRQVSMSAMTSDVVDIPEGLHTEDWVWKDQYATGFVQVGIDGDDIYISGMDRSLPEAWVKGTIADGKVSFPSGQYLGPDYYIGYFSYLYGASFHYEENPETGEEEMLATLEDAAIFDYDAENKMLTMVNGYVINSSDKEMFPLYAYDQVTVGVQHRNVDAVPATPYDLYYYENADYDESKIWVQIPNVDVEGSMLNENHLFYQILIDGEPMVLDPEIYVWLEEPTTDIPYNCDNYDIYVEGEDHTVYLYGDTGLEVGVRSVYINENGEALYSAIVTTETSSIASVDSGKEVVSETWHDLQGRQISRPTSGIAIRTAVYSDGSVSHKKVLIFN